MLGLRQVSCRMAFQMVFAFFVSNSEHALPACTPKHSHEERSSNYWSPGAQSGHVVTNVDLFQTLYAVLHAVATATEFGLAEERL